MSLFIDKKITFSEGSIRKVVSIRKNFLSTLENKKQKNKTNFFLDNKFFITLFVGLNSSYTKNNILNSDFYDGDITLQKNITPFNDDSSYLGNNITVPFNPKKKCVTYGQNILTEFFEEDENLPFEDMDNVENTGEYFKNQGDILYPRYIENYAVSKLNSNINVFGLANSISGEFLFKNPIKGLKADLIQNSIDARGRQVSIKNKLSYDELVNYNKDAIEPYLDEGIDLANNNSPIMLRNYETKKEIFNNRVITVFDTSENASSEVVNITNSINYFSEDFSNILPFNDTKKDFYKELKNTIVIDGISSLTDNVYKEIEVYNDFGYTIDNQISSLPNSIAFIREEN